MNRLTTVSVIIPAYNIEDCLQRAVKSALDQTFSPIEILIVDNNSTDNTLLIARRLEASYPNLVKVFQAHQQGAPFARNLGLAEAHGEWIQFLDGDDQLMPQKLEYQIAFIKESTSVVISGAIDKDLNGAETSVPISHDVWKGLFDSGGYLGYTSSILWKTEAVRSVGGWDTTLQRTQEYDLMFRLLTAGYQVTVAPVAYTIRYRRASGQISAAPYAEFLYTSIPLRSKILQYLLLHPEYMKGNASYYMSTLFRLYARLQERNPGYASRVYETSITPIFTTELKRKYPRIYWYQLRTHLYVVYKKIKKKLGRRGILGKIIVNH